MTWLSTFSSMWNLLIKYSNKKNSIARRVIDVPVPVTKTMNSSVWSPNAILVFLSLCLLTGSKSVLHLSTLQCLFVVQWRLQGICPCHHPHVCHFHSFDRVWSQTGEFPLVVRLASPVCSSTRVLRQRCPIHVKQAYVYESRAKLPPSSSDPFLLLQF